ncbi:heptaprenyl diphosphate synthase subunit 1 [Tumebacillus sp. BK434]|uniref:heptaprenyl diphosphate synthase component 1 n=1 Tax=Tumebacillus sp. BK434 TaxID=2512169 RepID=UPI0010EF1ABB|nr:heptaprenyl diphosphate synthase component 1 [Tumebacillus sp. BK434]TCP59349.1 heptaprenyl diphosphate synthase subunit 1 [Tumebacillus sp. BK434]
MQVQQRIEETCVQDIRSKLYAEMDHKYLSAIIAHPTPEKLQLALSEAMCEAAGLNGKETETIVSTLLLIYHGLALHEEIETLARHEDERYRQLGVLGGAYYSSKYYRLLAESGQIKLLGQFARAIQSINEVKAELVRVPGDFTLSVERYLHMQETIHGALLRTLCAALLPEQAQWEQLVTHLVRASVLKAELDKMSDQTWVRGAANLSLWQQANGEEKKWLKAIKASGEPDKRLMSLYVKYGTSIYLFSLLEEAASLAEPAMMMMHGLRDELRALPEQLLAPGAYPRRVCEEG